MEINDINLKELIEEETGNRFNRSGHILCPFHNDKTPNLAVKFNPNTNKEHYKCFSCGAYGDAIDFIQNFKGMNMKDAKEYLGMEVKKTPKEERLEKVKSYIDWQSRKAEGEPGSKKGYKLINIYEFVNADNEVIYYKAKFLRPDGKKIASYYSIKEDGTVTSLRPSTEVPYNLYNVLEGIKKRKVIIAVEGEKDADMLNYWFKNKGYIATSFKGCKDFSILTDLDNIKLWICGDTGEAGQKYIDNIRYEFFNYTDELRIIKLPYLSQLGDNKDVTDWIEMGNKKEDFLLAAERSLDLKDNRGLHQNKNGIWHKVVKGRGENEEWVTTYITDFQVLEAKRMTFIDDNQEGIYLKLKSQTGKIFERTGLSTVFDDVKSFRNFLGTIDLSFMGKINELTQLKQWVNKYFAIDSEDVYKGVKFQEINGEIQLITAGGAIHKNGINPAIKTDDKDGLNINNIDPISKEDLKDVAKNIFNFATLEKSIPLVGAVINSLFSYHSESIGEKINHTLIVGEAGSGKSSLIEDLAKAILNYPHKDIVAIGMATPFGLVKTLSSGNYPVLAEEFKPSTWDKFKTKGMSELLRNSYDRHTVVKGHKTLETSKFHLARPLIMAGEETYPNSETALMERSCIIYLSKNDRTSKTEQGFGWLRDNREKLNRFGRTLINEVLSISIEEYESIYRQVESRLTGKLNTRMLTTGINLAMGIELFNRVLSKHKLTGLPVSKSDEYIVANITEEILDGNEDTHSVVENMLLLYNDMIEDSRVRDVESYIQYEKEKLYIRTNEVINQIFDFCNKVGSAEVVPLKLRDFKKQARKAGYIISKDSVTRKIIVDPESDKMKRVRFDQYSIKKIRDLKIFLDIIPDIYEVEKEDNTLNQPENKFEWDDLMPGAEGRF